MIWVDWALLGVLVVSILVGAVRGFTREFFGLASWLVAIAAALFLAPGAASYLEGHVSIPSVRIAVAYALVFFAGLVIGAIITSVVTALVRKSPLSGLDRMVGGGFGLVRGALLAVMLVWLVGLTPARQDPWWSQSAFIGKLQWLADGFARLVPEAWQQGLNPAVANAKEGL